MSKTVVGFVGVRSASAGLVLWLAAAGVIAAQGQTPPAGESRPTYVPMGQKEDPKVQAQRRKDRQMQTLEEFEVFHDFLFQDRQPESGLDFVHGITDDSGKHYRPNHYDHGNGIAVADIDGDGKYDVYLVNQIGANGMFRNLGGGRFQDVTAASGTALQNRVSVAASFGDIDNDGDPDLFVTTVRFGNVLFENDGTGRFRDITEQAGVGYVGHSSGAVFFDYDNDGLLDLFVTNVGSYTTDERGEGGYYVGLGLTESGALDAFGGHLRPERFESSILYRNLGGNRFEDVSEATGLVDTSWSGDASPVDLNRDGWQDLYVLNMQGDDHYYENVEGKRFVEKGASLFPKTPWGSMGVKFFDSNNDGLLDLFLSDMHSDMSQPQEEDQEKQKADVTWSDKFLQDGSNNVFGNAFYRQNADGTFSEISDENGTENYWPWGHSVEDLNADGWDDIFIASSMNYGFKYHPNSVLLNNNGEKFLDSEYILGVEPRRDGRAMQPWFPLACDGVDRTHELCKDKQGKYVLLGALGSRSSALFDLDDDGDVDIVTNEFFAEPMVLISNLSEKKKVNFLKVRLIGTKSNRDGLGAVVKVVAGEKSWMKVLDGQSGYLSQSVLPLYFGLGEVTAIDRIEVSWPSGATQTVSENLGINSLVEITEPSS